MSKRIFGYLNWQRNRAKTLDIAITTRLVDDLKRQTPDHIAVTGDLVNIALETEFQNASRFLATLGPADRVMAIPGNHDAYVPGGRARFDHHCAPYLTSDAGIGGDPYPIIRRRGDLTLIGLSTAVATPPLMATGWLGTAQCEALEAALSTHRDTFRVVLIHHPPFEGATKGYKRMTDAKAFRAIIARQGAELILHGHTHLPTRETIAGPHVAVPVVGVSSAAQGVGGHRPPARYNLFEIASDDDGWTVTCEERGDADGDAETVVR